MSDIVLTSLINLFALFCTSSNMKRERAKSVIYHYLVDFFAIRNYEEYLTLYDTVCDVYELSLPDPEKTIETVCKQLRQNVPEEWQVLLLLRLMEFLALDREAYEQQKGLTQTIAKQFGISSETYDDCENFTFHAGQGTGTCPGRAETTSSPQSTYRKGNVGATYLEQINGTIKLLRLAKFNTMIVAIDCEAQLFMNDRPMKNNIFMVWEKNVIIKSHKSGALYYNHITSMLLGSDKEQKAVNFRGKNVNFLFPNSDNGLHDFSFSIHGGELVAIMGGSGTGKSTLISILNGTLPPHSGSITINGQELYQNQSSLRSHIGYVPQDDLLIAELTVYQNLLYTARFCFDGITEEELRRRVEKTLQDLDLLAIKDIIVGSPLNKTISGGQRKRLNIALELIREPQILFLDEPTSGLSSADSENVLHLLKNQTYNGKLVITCIHQPSSDIYKLFDRLWLLDRGGYPIYNGNPIEAISYFKTAANFVDAETSVCNTCGNINTEIILNIVDSKALDSNGQFTDRRLVEPKEWKALFDEKHRKDHEEKVKRLGKDSIHKQEIQPLERDKDSAKPGRFKQFLIYLQRNVHTKIQDKQFLLIAFLEAPVLALIVATLTHYTGDDGYTLFDNKNLLSYMFMAIIVAIFMGMSMNAQEIFRDKALLKRESFLQLSYASYIFSKIFSATVISLVQTLLFILVGNTLLGISCLFMQWWAVMFVSSLLASLIGLVLSQRLKSLVAIYITIPLLLIPQILLCGVVVNFSDLNRHSETNNVPFYGDLIPSRWAFEAIAVTMFTDNEYSKDYFNNEQKQYEMQIACGGYIKELKQCNERAWLNLRLTRKHGEDDNFTLMRGETQKLTDKYSLEPFALIESLKEGKYNEQVYNAYKQWLTRSDRHLHDISVLYTKAIDKDKQAYINQHGNKALIQLEKDNTNRQLKETLVSPSLDNMVKAEGDVLVPQTAAVYLTPPSDNGRAPFYSSTKRIGQLTLQTFQFNIIVLIIMCLAVTLALLRKPKN